MKKAISLTLSFLMIFLFFAGCKENKKAEQIDELTSNTYTIVDIEGQYKTQGRTRTTAKGLSLSHTATSFEFNAYCEGDIKADISVSSITDESGYGVYFTVFVDGVRQKERISVKKNGDTTITVAKKLELGEHFIQLFRQTENERGNITLVSIKLNGELKDAPKDNELLIEFIGDGLTTGYGIKASGNMSSLWGGAPTYQDGTATYAFLAANNIGADISIVASEKMALCAAHEDNLAINMYSSFPSSLGGEFAVKRKADIIVINLGSVDYFNRFSHEKSITDIKNSMLEFAKFIRENNPNAKIILASGMNDLPLVPYTKEAVEELGGKASNYYFLQLATDDLGVDKYSTAKGHKQSATVLAEFLKNELGVG